MALKDLPPLELSDNLVGDISNLADNADSLSDIITASTQVLPKIGIIATAKEVSKKTNIPLDVVKDSLLGLLNTHYTREHHDISPEEVIDWIVASLRRSKRKTYDEIVEKLVEKKTVIASAIAALGSDHPIVLASKALRVATTRQFEVVDLRIFTDIRPVFNSDATKIVQSVVTHVLEIDYHDGPDHRVIHFHLDAMDIDDLEELCARARQKAKVIKSDMQLLSWPTTVYMEPNE